MSRCHLFKGLDATWRDELARQARLARFQKDEVIFRQDDACPGLYVVREGRVRIYKLAPNGKHHILYLAGPGTTFAEVAAVSDFPCPANAQAMEETLCALIPTDRLTALLQAHHQLCLQFLRGMGSWVRHLTDLLEDLVLRDSMERVAQYLWRAAPSADSAPFELSLLKKDMACHLNMAGETLSRSLRALMDSGLIAMPDSHRVQILNPSALPKIAQGME